MKTHLIAAEAADLLRTTTGSLSNDRHRGTGPSYVKLGSRVLYRLADLEAYIAANMVEVAA